MKYLNQFHKESEEHKAIMLEALRKNPVPATEALRTQIREAQRDSKNLPEQEQ